MMKTVIRTEYTDNLQSPSYYMNIVGISAIKIAVNMRKVNQNIGIVILNSCSDLRLMGESNDEVPVGAKILIKKSLYNNLIFQIEKINFQL